MCTFGVSNAELSTYMAEFLIKMRTLSAWWKIVEYLCYCLLFLGNNFAAQGTAVGGKANE